MAQIHPQTETAVANEALSHLKQPPLVDLTADETTPAKIVRTHFASVRDALLRRYPWNAATERAKLNAQAAAPAFGFAYQYPLPNDCLTVRQVIGCRREDWKVEKRAILTDMPAPLPVIYTRRCVEVALWDALFRRAFTYELAVAVGPELSAEEDRINKCAEKAMELLEDAFPSDAAEGEPDEIEPGDWIGARFS